MQTHTYTLSSHIYTITMKRRATQESFQRRTQREKSRRRGKRLRGYESDGESERVRSRMQARERTRKGQKLYIHSAQIIMIITTQRLGVCVLGSAHRTTDDIGDGRGSCSGGGGGGM